LCPTSCATCTTTGAPAGIPSAVNASRDAAGVGRERSTPLGMTSMRDGMTPPASNTSATAREMRSHRGPPYFQRLPRIRAHGEIDAPRHDQAGWRGERSRGLPRAAACAVWACTMRTLRRRIVRRSANAASSPNSAQGSSRRPESRHRGAGGEWLARAGGDQRYMRSRSSSRASHSTWRSPPRHPRSVSRCITTGTGRAFARRAGRSRGRDVADSQQCAHLIVRSAGRRRPIVSVAKMRRGAVDRRSGPLRWRRPGCRHHRARNNAARRRGTRRCGAMSDATTGVLARLRPRSR